MYRYSNKKRSHIHFVHQYINSTQEYLGTRVVIFIKKRYKQIFDLGDFRIHKYKSPKSKRYKVSKWKIIKCSIKDVICKKMINTSLDDKYTMCNVLYESQNRDLYDFIEQAVYNEAEDYDIIKENVKYIIDKCKG